LTTNEFITPSRDDNWKRLKWLAKDVGFRQFEVYASNAVRLLITLFRHKKAEKQFFFGNDPLRATPFHMPNIREAPPSDANGTESPTEVVVRLTSEQYATLNEVREGASREQFIWFALWMYYDLLQDYDAGKRVYVGTERGPETEVCLRPEPAL
jgi:hypothetical protein